MLQLYILLFCVIKVFCEDPLINLPNGIIRGSVVQSPVDPNFSYYAYQGIPFAAPPVANLRFMPPQPVQNWEGIRNVTNNEITCYQTDREDTHSTEDCLYLSVYTPAAPSNATKLEILVFFYGGTFVHGHMDYGHQKSAFLVQEDVILVTLNYRVGPFGFLSTGDTVIPGNMGLKDQQFALKWVQQNIHLFGGDAQKVTIMGQSAGSASMTYQLLSPGSKGLFRAAIGCSGSALCDWASQRNAEDVAYGIAAEIDPTFSRQRTTKELLEFLQSVDVKEIVKTSNKYKEFSPVIEVPHDGAFISDYMYDSANNGNFNKVPVIMGINSEESIGGYNDVASWVEYVKSTYDKDVRNLVDYNLYITDDDLRVQVGEEIKQMYVGQDTFENNPEKGVQVKTDNRFARAIIKFAELLSQYVDLYFYQFSYHGEVGGRQVIFNDIGNVAHAEDQKYFWSYFSDYSQFPQSDVTAVRRYNKLFVNFIKHLNPTPVQDELFQNLTWPKVSNGSYYYLDIDKDLSIQNNPRNFSYAKWVDIYEKYGRKPYITF